MAMRGQWISASEKTVYRGSAITVRVSLIGASGAGMKKHTNGERWADTEQELPEVMETRGTSAVMAICINGHTPNGIQWTDWHKILESAPTTRHGISVTKIASTTVTTIGGCTSRAKRGESQ